MSCSWWEAEKSLRRKSVRNVGDGREGSSWELGAGGGNKAGKGGFTNGRGWEGVQ